MARTNPARLAQERRAWLQGTPVEPGVLRYEISFYCWGATPTHSQSFTTDVVHDVTITITGEALAAHDVYHGHHHAEVGSRLDAAIARIAELEEFIRAVCFAHHPDGDDPYPANWKWCEDVPPEPATPAAADAEDDDSGSSE